MILHGIYRKMSEVPLDEMWEWDRLVSKIKRVNNLQCTNDRSQYEEGKGEK